MSYTISELERAQLDFHGRLEAEPYFANIPVHHVRPRASLSLAQIQQRIDSALQCLVLKAGAGGAGVQVLMPTADATDPNLPGPRLSASIVVRVQELPVKNMGATGTGKTAEDIALHVLQLFHHFRTGGQIWVAAPDALTPSLQDDPLVTYDLKFTRLLQLPGVSKVAPVAIAAAAGLVTLTCPTPGAAILRSLDGAYPATPYTGPFAAASGALVRATAILAGLQQADITQLTV